MRHSRISINNETELLRQKNRAELIRFSALSKALTHPTSRAKTFIPETL